MSGSDRNEHVLLEDLSAYVDGEITDPTELERIERHLGSCDVCRRELDELRAVSELLSELPEIEAPRSFRLSPADVASTPESSSEPTPIQPWIMRHQSTFRYAGVAAALLLAVLVTFDVTRDDPEDVTDQAPVTMMEEDLDDPSEDAAMPEDAPIDDDDSPAVEPDADEPVDEPAIDADEAVPAEEEEAAEEEMPAEAEQERLEDQDDDPEPPAVALADADDEVLGPLQWAMIALGALAVLFLVMGYLAPRIWTVRRRTHL